jgi:hypothetical protein
MLAETFPPVSKNVPVLRRIIFFSSQKISGLYAAAGLLIGCRQ